MLLTKIHATAATVATLCIATFLSASITVELFGSIESIALVKKLIVTPGLFLLVPAIAITGATGFALGKNRRGSLVEAKQHRMPFIAANGLLVLLPAAVFLDQWASINAIDTRFYVVQILEILAGAVNLTLMGRNMRDGLKMTGKLRRKKP